MKRSYLKEAGDVIAQFFARFSRSSKKIFSGLVQFLSTKLRPVKEEQAEGKSLIDEFMKEYERKKK